MGVQGRPVRRGMSWRMFCSPQTCSDPTSTLEPSWPRRQRNPVPLHSRFLRACLPWARPGTWHLLPQSLLTDTLRGEQRWAAYKNLTCWEAVPHKMTKPPAERMCQNLVYQGQKMSVICQEQVTNSMLSVIPFVTFKGINMHLCFSLCILCTMKCLNGI